MGGIKMGLNFQELDEQSTRLGEIADRLEAEQERADQAFAQEYVALESFYQQRQEALLSIFSVPLGQGDLANKLLDLEGKDFYYGLGKKNNKLAITVRQKPGNTESKLEAAITVPGGFSRDSLGNYLRHHNLPFADDLGPKRNGLCRADYQGNSITFIEVV